MLQSFTEEAINVLKQDIEATKIEATTSKSEASKMENRQEHNANISELLKALDETHQQFRNKLMKSVQHQLPVKRQTSASKEEAEVTSEPGSAEPETPHKPEEVKKFLFKLDDLSGSKGSLDQNEDQHHATGSQNKPVIRVDPPVSPQPETHQHNLGIIEEQNEVDNQSENEIPIEAEDVQPKTEDPKV